MRSSYAKNNYGLIFTQTVMLLEPMVTVDLGLLDGYSLLHLAQGFEHLMAIQEPGCSYYPRMLYGFDLFEDYEFKHGSLQSIAKLIEPYNIVAEIEVEKADAFEIAEDFMDGHVDLLHIDISNDGDKVERLLELWYPKLSKGAIVLIEGGSEERDNVEWMKKYNKRPIRPVIMSPRIRDGLFHLAFIYPEFPSMTVLRKRGGWHG